MEDIKELNEEEIEKVTGGEVYITNGVVHWQPNDVPMGSAFTKAGYLWYRIKVGDTLGRIAAFFNTTVETLQANNRSTIKNPSEIYAGDAIMIRRVFKDEPDVM